MDATFYEFMLTGDTPLLMHADDIEFADELQEWRKDSKNKSISKPGDDRSPPWTWTGSVYSDGKQLVLPADNLAVALRQAGSKITLKGMKTFKEESVAGLMIVEEFLPVFVKDKAILWAPIAALREENDFKVHVAAVKKMGFELFMKRAAVGSSKHVRVRAMFRTWAVRGTVRVESKAINASVLGEMFGLAGRVGVGSWRPGGRTPGRFGMFSAVVKPAK